MPRNGLLSLVKFASGVFPSHMLRDFVPLETRREFDPKEKREINEGEKQWIPPIIQTDATPVSSLLASPLRQGALYGTLGAGAGGVLGGGLGYLGGLVTGHPSLGTGVGTLAGAGLGAGLLGGYKALRRHENNEHLKEMMRRLPPGATKRDLAGAEMMAGAIEDRFGGSFGAQSKYSFDKAAQRTCGKCGTQMKGAWCPKCRAFDWHKKAAMATGGPPHATAPVACRVDSSAPAAWRSAQTRQKAASEAYGGQSSSGSGTALQSCTVCGAAFFGGQCPNGHVQDKMASIKGLLKLAGPVVAEGFEAGANALSKAPGFLGRIGGWLGGSGARAAETGIARWAPTAARTAIGAGAGYAAGSQASGSWSPNKANMITAGVGAGVGAAAPGLRAGYGNAAKWVGNTRLMQNPLVRQQILPRAGNAAFSGATTYMDPSWNEYGQPDARGNVGVGLGNPLRIGAGLAAGVGGAIAGKTNNMYNRAMLGHTMGTGLDYLGMEYGGFDPRTRYIGMAAGAFGGRSTPRAALPEFGSAGTSDFIGRPTGGLSGWQFGPAGQKALPEFAGQGAKVFPQEAAMPWYRRAGRGVGNAFQDAGNAATPGYNGPLGAAGKTLGFGLGGTAFGAGVLGATPLVQGRPANPGNPNTSAVADVILPALADSDKMRNVQVRQNISNLLRKDMDPNNPQYALLDALNPNFVANAQAAVQRDKAMAAPQPGRFGLADITKWPAQQVSSLWNKGKNIVNAANTASQLDPSMLQTAKDLIPTVNTVTQQAKYGQQLDGLLQQTNGYKAGTVPEATLIKSLQDAGKDYKQFVGPDGHINADTALRSITEENGNVTTQMFKTLSEDKTTGPIIARVQSQMQSQSEAQINATIAKATVGTPFEGKVSNVHDLLVEAGKLQGGAGGMMKGIFDGLSSMADNLMGLFGADTSSMTQPQKIMALIGVMLGAGGLLGGSGMMGGMGIAGMLMGVLPALMHGFGPNTANMKPLGTGADLFAQNPNDPDVQKMNDLWKTNNIPPQSQIYQREDGTPFVQRAAPPAATPGVAPAPAS